MDKNYNHKNHEKEIYALWEKGEYFAPPSPLKLQRDKQKRKPFTIIMPPPNANDPLHIGHARFVTVEDTLIRYHRMKGEPTLWLPGADHAGIETQFVFEKKLKEQGKSRFDFDRETLYQMIWDYVQENKKTMESQLRLLGASCDWTREKFTLDPEIIKIVYQTFYQLNQEGLIYRAKRLVNYCTFCGTGYSNLEVDHTERADPLFYIRYQKKDGDGYVVVATTRPEPIFVDTHLAINPRDKKNSSLIGTKVLNPLTDKEMDIIGDEFVDPEFGTGIVKLTPAHDFDDFELAQKHGLPVVQAIDQSGKITKNGGKYSGLYVKQARQAVINDLQKKGLVEKIDHNYRHTIGICYRCKNVIEPMLMEQWFIKIEPLAKLVLKAVEDKEVKFAAEKYEKITKHWLNNIYDWNISRQIVWGIRIPAWKCNSCEEWTITDGATPQKCSCGSTELVQETDTFDTWFSSGQWPFATLKTTTDYRLQTTEGKQKDDFTYFYPTSVMETAYDILFFWVIRMLMFGLYKTKKVPFENVLIHGLVRDAQGQKISKSKGNVINPLEMSEKYGTDALRMGILWGALVENDVALSENNIKAQRNFTNKLWNIARFILSNETQITNYKLQITNKDDVWILEELKIAQKKITQSLEDYRLNEGAEALYDFIWNKLASTYIEKIKNLREESQPTLLFVLQESLKLAHPFMPFITEELWQTAREKNYGGLFKEDALIVAQWSSIKK